MDKITSLQAFKAMICFLDIYYNKTLSDDLGVLLGGIQLVEDESGTWDPAAWYDWLIALQKKGLITPIDGFKGMYNFLNAYYIRTSCSSTDIKELLDKMDILGQQKLLSSSIWHTWVECVQNVESMEIISLEQTKMNKHH